MLQLLFLLIILAAAALSGGWLLEHNGMVHLEWMNYDIETSVAFLGLMVGALLLLIVFALDVLRLLRGLPARLSLAASMNRQERALAVITDGFTALAINDARNVKKAAERAKKLLGKAQPLALLLSAEAARLSGSSKEARDYYAALAEQKKTEALGIKGLLTQAMKDKDNEGALRLAREAYRKHPRMEGVAATLVGLYQRAGKWAEALAVAERASHSLMPGRRKAFPPLERAHLMLMQAGELSRAGHDIQAEALLRKAYHLAPAELPVLTAYAEALLLDHKPKKAEDIILTAWQSAPHPELVRVLGKLHASLPPMKRVKKAEKLLKQNPENPAAHQLVAEAALAADDLTKARNHLKLAMRERETAGLCRLMARLEEKSGPEHEQEAREWHRKARSTFLDPAWVCTQCGHSDERWQMQCKSCKATNSMEWDESPRMAPDSQPPSEA
jgi:HemY protein